MDRRDFIRKSAVLAAAAAVPEMAGAAELVSGGAAAAVEGKLIDTPPMLQNYAATSMGISFGVSALANGYVEYSETEDFSNAVKVMGGGYRVTDMNSDVIQVRLTGLKPATKYYYRIGADRIDYQHGHSMHIIGSEKDQKTYSFTTAGPKADAHFCVINDTHGIFPALVPVVDKLLEINPSCVVWNGDIYGACEDVATQKTMFMNPPIEKTGFASGIPFMLCCGNHDSRGLANRHLERVWMYRQPEERPSRDWDLGRNFAVRMGDVAMIGLDTAEDKLDENPRFCGLFNSGAYREAQAVWLKDVLKRKEIASAPFLVAFCHIPIFSDDPTDNPGDVRPNDTDPSKYKRDFAVWQRTCHDLWSPLLEKAGCQLVISGHTHRFRYNAPDAGRKWGQLVGGGPVLGDDVDFPTVIEGKVEDRRLVVRVHNVDKGTVHETLTFKPRR